MFSKSKNGSSAEDTRTTVNTLIGEGAIFDGDLRTPESIRIDGTINGNCTCEQRLILGPKGYINGNISTKDVIISGKVDGDISAEGKLELLSTGKINGNIIAKSLVIDENAHFDGKCTMLASISEKADKPAGKSDDIFTDSFMKTDAETDTKTDRKKH